MLESFRRHSSAAVKEAQEKKRRMEEMDRKRKEKAEMERKREEEELKKRWMPQFWVLFGTPIRLDCFRASSIQSVMLFLHCSLSGVQHS